MTRKGRPPRHPLRQAERLRPTEAKRNHEPTRFHRSDQPNYAVPAQAAQWQKRWLIVGVVGALLCVVGAVTSLEQFLRGYLIAYMLWLGLSLGCLALLMVQYLSGGLWGLVIAGVFWKRRASAFR